MITCFDRLFNSKRTVTVGPGQWPPNLVFSALSVKGVR
jgi:hypothetical protein